jgi:hypothetical protein
MNWGVKIAIGLGVCMLAVVLTVVYMIRQNTDTLEDSDYYERGLSYDDVYAMKVNLQRDGVEPVLEVLSDTLAIRFVSGNNQGELLLRRRADHNQDVRVPVNTGGATTFRLPMQAFSRGAWQLVLEWESGGTPYYMEKDIFLKE